MQIQILLVLLCFAFSNFLFAQQDIFLSPQPYNLKKFSTIQEKIPPPQGFKRVNLFPKSFATYLRRLPVIVENAKVMDFKNHVRVTIGDSSLAAVVPIDISGKQLWQCMDIILAFRADQLKVEKKTDSIEFPLPEGTNLSWAEWHDGFRPIFSGLSFYKNRTEEFDSSQNSFRKYLNTIFSYSNSQTFYHHYSKVALSEIMPGDFIVKKGKKGHAVLIVDIAENERHEKVALIGQGDTPACQFYLLKNKDGTPWFKISNGLNYPDLPIRKKMVWDGLRRFPL